MAASVDELAHRIARLRRGSWHEFTPVVVMPAPPAPARSDPPSWRPKNARQLVTWIAVATCGITVGAYEAVQFIRELAEAFR